ncbi:MAG: DNA methyltransferase [Myxococcota bacterium]
MRGFSDPAFHGNKALPVHRWVPWIAGFSSGFAGNALDRLREPGTVLDPFCGVGTTLVESALRGHRAIGFEINPWAALASRTKVHAAQFEPARLDQEIRRFEGFHADALTSGRPPHSQPPPGFRTRAPFYSEPVLRKVLFVTDFIERLAREEPLLADLFRVAFGATLVSYSNYSYEPSLGRRVAAGRPEVLDFDVGASLASKLREMEEDVRWLRASPAAHAPTARVHHASFLDTPVVPESVDLILTSPPYLNNYHYNRNTRPHLYWLGFVAQPSEMRELEEANFGKYWQTVRERERVELEFELPSSDLAERLLDLRARHPERGIYGGGGWANYATCYFNDCWRFAAGMQRALRPGGVALVVIGNSILQGLEIATDRYLGQIAERVGLELADIQVPRATRVGSSIIRSGVRAGRAQAGHELYEAVVEVRRRD